MMQSEKLYLREIKAIYSRRRRCSTQFLHHDVLKLGLTAPLIGREDLPTCPPLDADFSSTAVIWQYVLSGWVKTCRNGHRDIMTWGLPAVMDWMKRTRTADSCHNPEQRAPISPSDGKHSTFGGSRSRFRMRNLHLVPSLTSKADYLRIDRRTQP